MNQNLLPFFFYNVDKWNIFLFFREWDKWNHSLTNLVLKANFNQNTMQKLVNYYFLCTWWIRTKVSLPKSSK